MPQHIRKGDMVVVIAGDDAKRVSPDGRKVPDRTPRKVLRVIPSESKVVVEGVNVRKRHQRRTQANPQGGVIEKEMPIHMSNVQPVVDGKPTRVRFQRRDDGAKIRVAARTGEQIGQELKKAPR